MFKNKVNVNLSEILKLEPVFKTRHSFIQMYMSRDICLIYIYIYFIFGSKVLYIYIYIIITITSKELRSSHFVVEPSKGSRGSRGSRKKMY